MAGEVSGNQQLPAEVLELVFRHLEHSDLATLLLVCRFWAEVAGRPRLWSDLRLAVTPATLPVLPRLLGLRRLAALRALTVAWPPDSRARAAIAGHPAIVALTYRDLGRPRKAALARHAAIFDLAIDSREEEWRCSKVEEVRVRSCYLQCGQLSSLLTAMVEGRTAITSLLLNRLGCGCPYSHSCCPLPPALLARASHTLRKLTLDTLGWTCNLTTEQLESFLLGILPDTQLEELTLASFPLAAANPSILATALTRVSKLTLSTSMLSLDQCVSLFTALQAGDCRLRELSIYNLPSNPLPLTTPYNMLDQVHPTLLSGALCQLEKAAMEHCYLTSDQVVAVLGRARGEASRLQELRVDRYDREKSHLYLPPSLTDNTPFLFQFNQ